MISPRAYLVGASDGELRHHARMAAATFARVAESLDKLAILVSASPNARTLGRELLLPVVRNLRRKADTLIQALTSDVS